MNEVPANAANSGPVTIYCTGCGQAMLVAPEHIQTPVSCPHCQETLEPWRVAVVPRSTPPPMPPPVPPAYGHGPLAPAGYSWRNRWLAGALAILLGTFGVHRFYLGFVGIGILQLALTVCSCFTLVWVIYIWACVEGILCFCGAMRDADGLPLSG